MSFQVRKQNRFDILLMKHRLFVLDDLFDDQYEVLIFFSFSHFKISPDLIFFISMKKLVLNFIYFHNSNLPFFYKWFIENKFKTVSLN